jgi:hypothetical protein
MGSKFMVQIAEPLIVHGLKIRFFFSLFNCSVNKLAGTPTNQMIFLSSGAPVSTYASTLHYAAVATAHTYIYVGGGYHINVLLNNTSHTM